MAELGTYTLEKSVWNKIQNTCNIFPVAGEDQIHEEWSITEIWTMLEKMTIFKRKNVAFSSCKSGCFVYINFYEGKHSILHLLVREIFLGESDYSDTTWMSQRCQVQLGKNSMFVKSWGENVFLTEKIFFNTHLVDQDVSYVTCVVEFGVWPPLLRYHTTPLQMLI